MPAAQGAVPWPDRVELNGRSGAAVTFPSHSPFTPAAVGGGPERDPPTAAVGTLFMPEAATAADPVPAVILLHGASGVQQARELTYGGQFAALGVAALVIDAFAARRDRGAGFTERLVQVTESMVLADAYAGLRWLAAKPEIDGARIARPRASECSTPGGIGRPVGDVGGESVR